MRQGGVRRRPRVSLGVAVPGLGPLAGRGTIAGPGPDPRERRQAEDELAAPAEPLAPGLDAPPVLIHQATDERQADTQPPLGSVEGSVDLREQVEDLREHVGGDADAAVADAEDGVVAVAADGQVDPAAVAGVLGRVVQDVRQDLREPGLVGLHPERFPGALHGEDLAAGLDERPAGLHGVGDDRRDVEGLLVELDLAAGDPRDVEEVVDEPDHLLDLPVDHVARPAEVDVVDAELLEELDGVADRREGIPQFVGEHRQELVLAAVVLLDVPIEPRVVDRYRGAAGEVLGEAEIGRPEPTSRPPGRERQRAQDPAARLARDDHRRASAGPGPASPTGGSRQLGGGTPGGRCRARGGSTPPGPGPAPPRRPRPRAALPRPPGRSRRTGSPGCPSGRRPR